ncbi:hypothetical protein MAR_031877 [Mya arenaria]|uniref:Uncharacterized protein n=1 Tax=Mya arenaria TaxID=6604 RepID=A0ABY7F4Z7_MYAAR|nr:hypothetical protein MAR_031877 [Mya arenaria]
MNRDTGNRTTDICNNEQRYGKSMVLLNVYTCMDNNDNTLKSKKNFFYLTMILISKGIVISKFTRSHIDRAIMNTLDAVLLILFLYTQIVMIFPGRPTIIITITRTNEEL